MDSAADFGVPLLVSATGAYLRIALFARVLADADNCVGGELNYR